MSNKKQSSIDWLNRWFIDNQEATYEEGKSALKKAKAMHKEEVVNAYQAGDGDAYNLDETRDFGEQYYNETFG